MQKLVERYSKLDGPQVREKLFVIFQNFTVVKPMPIFLTNVKLSVLNFFILSKIMCKKVNFSQNFKGPSFVVIRLSFLARHLGALYKICKCATLVKKRRKS